MSRDDPYHDHKPYHFADKIRSDGAVSPLCAARPRALNLRRERWTLLKSAVTCKRCIEALKLRRAG
jgi:hypothetical protein